MIRLTLSVKTLLVYAAVAVVMLSVLVAMGFVVLGEGPLDPEEVKGKFVFIAFAGSILTVLAVGAGMIYVRTKVAAPINRLIDAARRLDRGERDVLVGRLGTGDELDELAEAFDSMSRDISTAWEHLENEVRVRTEEIERANRELLRLNETLSETVRAKSEFLSNMSHELRTPMNAVIGYAHCLLDGLDGPLNEEQRSDVERILNGADSLLKLVNDLLDLSRMEAKRLEVRPEETPLAQIVEAVVSSIRPQAAAKDLRIDVEVPSDLPVYADPVRTRQVLLNIAANAVKFTEKGSVRISARAADGATVIEIADTGIGIEREDLGRIFETFVQVDSSASRRHGGAGLGLAIAKRLVEMMNGSIEVQSQYGRGSTFTVRLPSAPPAREAVPDSAPIVGSSVPTVVAIDDDPDALELIRRSLAPAGFAVVGARTGAEGVRLARLLSPVAITLDIMLPDRDGWDVLREIHDDPTTARIPVFVVSIVQERPRAFALGAVDYFEKPVNLKDLAEKVRLRVGSLDGRAVLAVDDDEGDLDLLRRSLRDVPCRLITVKSAEDALRRAESERPSLILLDLRMPGMDGFQLLEALRVRKETRDVPVFIFTAKDLTPEEIVRLRVSAAETIFRKGSVTSTDLVTEVRRVLAGGAA